MSRPATPNEFALNQSEAMAHYDVTRPTIIRWRKEGIVKAKRRGKHWFYRREPIHVVEKRRAACVKEARSAAGKRATKAEIMLFEIEQSLDVAEEDMTWLVHDGTSKIDKGWRGAFKAPRLVSTSFSARRQVDDARLRLERARNLISPRAFGELESRWRGFENALEFYEKQILLFLRQLALQVQEIARAAFTAQLAQNPAVSGPAASEANPPVLSEVSKKEEEK